MAGRDRPSITDSITGGPGADGPDGDAPHGPTPRTDAPRPEGSGVASAPVCPLCDRPLLPGPSADEHHLVPRSQGGTRTVRLHRVCHQKIHATLSERELRNHYSTAERLRAHPEIRRFIAWLANKPPGYFDRTGFSRLRRR